MITLENLDFTEQDLKDMGYTRHKERIETLINIVECVNKGKVKNDKFIIAKWIGLRLNKLTHMLSGR